MHPFNLVDENYSLDLVCIVRIMNLVFGIIIIVINIYPGYEIKLHPVVEFLTGIMRLPFAATTSRSPLSKV